MTICDGCGCVDGDVDDYELCVVCRERLEEALKKESESSGMCIVCGDKNVQLWDGMCNECIAESDTVGDIQPDEEDYEAYSDDATGVSAVVKRIMKGGEAFEAPF